MLGQGEDDDRWIRVDERGRTGLLDRRNDDRRRKVGNHPIPLGKERQPLPEQILHLAGAPLYLLEEADGLLDGLLTSGDLRLLMPDTHRLDKQHERHA